MQPYFRHCMLKSDTDKSKLPKKIGISPHYIAARSSRFHSHAIRIEEGAREVATSNGRPFNESEVVVCPFLLGRYRHIFAYTWPTYSSCLTGVDVITWRGRGIEFEEMRNSYKPTWSSWSPHSPWAPEVSTRTIDAICGLKYPTTVTGLRSLFALCNVFCRFVPNFARFAALLNKKLHKGKLQTFHRLSNDEIIASEILKACLQ